MDRQNINSILLFRSTYESIMKLDEELRADAALAVFEYAFEGIYIPFNNDIDIIMPLITASIDNSIQYYLDKVESGYYEQKRRKKSIPSRIKFEEI